MPGPGKQEGEEARGGDGEMQNAKRKMQSAKWPEAISDFSFCLLRFALWLSSLAGSPPRIAANEELACF
jgi:hypothetical protein